MITLIYCVLLSAMIISIGVVDDEERENCIVRGVKQKRGLVLVTYELRIPD